MEYVLLFLFGWIVVCLPAIVVTVVANGRRRRETAELNDKLASLSRQLEALERRTQVDAARVQPAAQPAPAVAAMKISAEETRPAASPVSPIAPVREPMVPKQPAAVSAQPSSRPAVAPPVAAHAQLPPPSSQPRPVEVGRIPLTPGPHRLHRRSKFLRSRQPQSLFRPCQRFQQQRRRKQQWRQQPAAPWLSRLCRE
jgi:hypothetical protein